MSVLLDLRLPAGILVAAYLEPLKTTRKQEESAKSLLIEKLKTIRSSINTSAERTMIPRANDEYQYAVRIATGSLVNDVSQRAHQIALTSLQQYYDTYTCLHQLRKQEPWLFEVTTTANLRANYDFLHSVFSQYPVQPASDVDLICRNLAAMRFFQRQQESAPLAAIFGSDVGYIT